jgi:bifunctional UDP-N-acetylglucosamine pyrophosphorylase/glucosamine-1-phosphate N-acetyltransferase
MRDPATARVDVTATLAEDVELGPDVGIHGTTTIGRGARIGQGCVLVDSQVGEGVEVKPYSHFEGAVVGARSIIGPFARLRPGTVLAEEVHIGNFVETKKARIGRKSKANHLAYLGDAVIGEGCNIGAGTITCNYDGVHKHETRLGDGVFIGSDSQLVAPVSLGDGAYVGAGSTITKDVPADALAFTRPPLTVKEGWASRRKAKSAAGKPGV